MKKILIRILIRSQFPAFKQNVYFDQIFGVQPGTLSFTETHSSRRLSNAISDWKTDGSILKYLARKK